MNNFQIQYPHSFPIISSFIPENSFNIIKKEVYHWLETNYEKLSTPWNCPTLTSIHLSYEENPKLPELEKQIKYIVQQYISTFFIPTNELIIQKWVNISPPVSYQETHHHLEENSKQILSGTLYIDVPQNSGDFFIKNHLDKEYMLLGLRGMEEFKIEASNRKIIIFPSWMEHRVGINHSTQNRISISWNITNKI